jgi:hypothetical protein
LSSKYSHQIPIIKSNKSPQIFPKPLRKSEPKKPINQKFHTPDLNLSNSYAKIKKYEIDVKTKHKNKSLMK